MLTFVGAGLVLTNAAESKCVNPDENVNLFTSAVKGDQVALATLEKKSAAGDFCAKDYLGGVYARGKKKAEGERLEKEAFAEYQAAAENGDPEAQAFIGSHILYQGEYKDKARATELLRKAANQGHKEAMFNVGRLYDGIGSFYFGPEWEDNDLATAADWYMKSAKKGYQPAYKFLADMYAEGEGVPQNWRNAYFWGCLATECFAAEPPPWEAALCLGCAPSRISSDPLAAQKHLGKSDIETLKKQAGEWKPGTSLPIEEPGFFQKIRCRLQTPC